jgi:hypothetical protein
MKRIALEQAGLETQKNFYVEISTILREDKKISGALTEDQKQLVLQAAARATVTRNLLEQQREFKEAQEKIGELGAAHTKEIQQLAEHYRDLLDPARKYERELEAINALQRAGRLGGGLSDEEAMAARFNVYARRLDDLRKTNKEATDEITEFWKSAAQNMQSSMSNFFFDVMQGELGGLGRSFKLAIDRMVADVLAAKAATALFGQDFGKAGGSIGGLVGQALGSLGIGGGSSALGAIGAGASEAELLFFSLASIAGAQHGADWMVGGAGGTDSQLVAFRATPGERVRVETPDQQRSDGQGRRAMQVNMVFPNVTDAAGVRASRSQTVAAYRQALAYAARND